MTNPPPEISTIVEQNLKRRYRAERRFKFLGQLSIGFGLLCLVLLFTDIVSKGIGAFQQSYIKLEVVFDPARIGITDARDKEQLQLGNFNAVLRDGLKRRFPDVSGRRDLRAMYRLVSSDGEFFLLSELERNPSLLGQTKTYWLLADDDVDVYFKYGLGEEEPNSRLNGLQQSLVAELADTGELKTRFNKVFFTRADSREPETAGIWGAVTGSFFTLLVTLLLSFPVGVAAAIYLEEFAPKNKITDLIEVNINNLAAVPSIIFGLLGLAIIINLFGLPRSVPLVGGIVLSLMTLPTIIISSRAAIKAVPPSIREAALGMGASKVQMVLHHVLPLAMPGMLTGTIIGMAQALGETAPLLMIGMVAFIVDIPGGITDPSTVLPVQIFIWADSPERAFVERTSAAIMVLLAFLITMNTAAVLMRKKLERRW